jgi:DNA-binding GntR family transcriptional regulator
MQVTDGLLPRYLQLNKILENRIRMGEFHQGGRFPKDEELCI